jgi:hypothetical protein
LLRIVWLLFDLVLALSWVFTFGAFIWIAY